MDQDKDFQLDEFKKMLDAYDEGVRQAAKTVPSLVSNLGKTIAEQVEKSKQEREAMKDKYVSTTDVMNSVNFLVDKMASDTGLVEISATGLKSEIEWILRKASGITITLQQGEDIALNSEFLEIGSKSGWESIEYMDGQGPVATCKGCGAKYRLQNFGPAYKFCPTCGKRVRD